MPDSITIDGVGPMPVEQPTTVAELCAIVRRCAASNTAIYPVGGGTMLDYGMPPARVGVAISTNHLNHVIDYPARDLTITVQTGITMQKLQDTLAAENQWLPIDIPPTATIGGAIACDVSGPRRYGYGTLRDYVIGITVVNDRGEETHAGGRVVKNVAGYDMMKLHTGALGTLGIITQVTLKVKPKPERSVLVHFRCSFEAANTVLDQLSSSDSRMICFHFRPKSFIFTRVQAAATDQDSRWRMAIGFEGQPEAVTFEASQLIAELTRYVPLSRIKTRQFDSADQMESDNSVKSAAYFAMRVRVMPSKTAEMCSILITDAPQIDVYADAASGIIAISGPPELSRDNAIDLLKNAIGRIETAEGAIIIERCPTEWKKSLPVWGRPPADLALQKAVKRALDPRNLFNPGRFITEL
jgi:glycolate oxidase FAD binding subunit